MVKAIIFDIGGTLIKTDEAILVAIEIALEENGILLKNNDEVVHSFGKSTYHSLAVAVKSSYSGGDVEEKIKKCQSSFEKIFPIKVREYFTIFPGVIEALQTLKNKNTKLALFTCFKKKEAEFLLNGLSLFSYFDFMITRDDVEKLRPDPEALLKVLEKLKVSRDECIYVGDTSLDIKMAKNAKMKMVCVKTGMQSNDI